MSTIFDDQATLAMGAAFDLACASLRGFSRDDDAREAIAKRIIEVAAKGERDPVRLHSQAFMGFRVDDLRGVSHPRSIIYQELGPA